MQELALLVVPVVGLGAAFGLRAGVAAAAGSAAAFLAVSELSDHSNFGAASSAAVLVSYFGAGAIAGIAGGSLARQRAEVRACRSENAELRASATQLVTQALDAEERERERIAQGLHDGAMQTLIVANQDLIEAGRGREQVTQAQLIVADVIGEMRNACRTSTPRPRATATSRLRSDRSPGWPPSSGGSKHRSWSPPMRATSTTR